MNFLSQTQLYLTLVGALFSIALPSTSQGNPSQMPNRILFVAPHPDDEVLGTGGQIWQAQQSSDVDYRVVLMTCGDGYPESFKNWVDKGWGRDLNHDGKIDFIDFGIQRHAESLRALALLGVPRSKVIFLGYPDGGLDQLSGGQKPFKSPFTQSDKVPYRFAFHHLAPYTAESVVADLKKIIQNFSPTLVYTTTPTDEHADHMKTRQFVVRALSEMQSTAFHLEYLIHWENHLDNWPGNSAKWPDMQTHIAPDLVINFSDIYFSRARLAEVIRQYTSQYDLDADYLSKFAKDSEIFWYSRGRVSDYYR